MRLRRLIHERINAEWNMAVALPSTIAREQYRDARYQAQIALDRYITELTV